MSGEVLMTLGQVRFSVQEGSYQRLRRRLEVRVGRQDRASAQTARQPIGLDETLEIEGVVYAAFSGGTGRLDTFRAMARTLQPQVLTDGRGNVWGQWLVEEVEEEATEFTTDGVPLRQAFRLALGLYGG